MGYKDSQSMLDCVITDECVFSKDNKRVRYVGIAKNQFAEFMKAICFNLIRLLYRRVEGSS